MKRTGMVLATAAAIMAGTVSTATAQESWTGEQLPPGAPDKSSYLTTISSANSATWALGYRTRVGAPTGFTAQAFFRDKVGHWSEVPVPNIGTITASATTSESDAWAVSPSGKMNPGGMIHWDGKAWTEVPLEAPPEAPRISPTDVAAIGKDVWTIGKAYRDGNDSAEFSFARHWDGAAWQDVPLPPEANELSFTSVNGTSSDDVWMVGTGGDMGSQLTAMHWDGKTWTSTPVPEVELPQSHYLTAHDVAAYAPDDVWLSATHSIYNDANGDSPVLMHWDGKTWTQQEVPVKGGLGKLVRAEDALWILAKEGLLRYDGKNWQTVAGPKEGALSDGTNAPTGQLLGIGSHGPSQQPQPFASAHHR